MSKQRKIEQAKEEILELIKKNKGICSVLLFEEFGGRYTRSHILYFLRALEKERLIRTFRENKYLYCYLYEDDPKSAQNQLERKRFLLQNLNRKSDGRINDVLAAVKANQGITKAGIAKALSLYRNTSGYYVDLLEKHGFLQVKDLNHRKCCFTSEYDRDFTYLNQSQKRTLGMVMEHPGLCEKELRERTGQGQQLLYRNLKNLLAKDKVLRDKKGGGVYRYYPAKTLDSEFDLFLDAGER